MIYITNSKNMHLYWLNLQQDLFETWCVHKIYDGLTALEQICGRLKVKFGVKISYPILYKHINEGGH